MKISDLTKWKKLGKRIGIYGAGLHGKEFKSLLELCGISIDFFCDNSDEKENKLIHGVICIKPYSIEEKEDCIIIVCVGIENYVEIYELAKRQIGKERIVDFREILDAIILDEELMKKVMQNRYETFPTDLFYTNIEERAHKKANLVKLDGERIAIYTACFGNYDNLVIPKKKPENVDYYFISDERPKENKVYKWIDARTVIPEGIADPIRRNRFAKMHPDLFFPQYKYSIYVDSNIQIQDDISSFICESKTGISVFAHSRRDCLFYEAMTIVNHKRIVPEDAIHQMSKYLTEGMPLHYGLTEMPIIAREHNNTACKNIMKLWWKEFNKESQRDQLSFTYALWKKGWLIDDLAILGDDVRHHEKLRFLKHNKDSESVKNEGVN